MLIKEPFYKTVTVSFVPGKAWSVINPYNGHFTSSKLPNYLLEIDVYGERVSYVNVVKLFNGGRNGAFSGVFLNIFLGYGSCLYFYMAVCYDLDSPLYYCRAWLFNHLFVYMIIYNEHRVYS